MSAAARPRRSAALLAAALALAALLAAALAPAAARAHAELEGTRPERGAVVPRTPEQVVFHFSEPVEGAFGAVRVFDAAGRRVEEGEVFHPGGRSSDIGVRLRGGLPDGTYTATYRVVSADSHVVSGGVVFSIGRPSAAGATVAELLADGDGGPVARGLLGLARALQFGAIAVGLGALAFLVLVWRRALPAAIGAGRPSGDDAGAGWADASAAFLRRLRRLVTGAALVGALAGALGIVMQGAEAAGISGLDALDPAIVEQTLTTRFGTVWGIGVLAWVALGAIAWVALGAAARRAAADEGMARDLGAPPAGAAPAGAALGWPVAPAAVPAAALLLLPGLGGHAAAQSPVAVLLPANAIHVAATCVWAGGLVTLLLALPAATRRLAQPAARSRLLAAALLRFSPLALWSVAAILTSGIVQSLLYLDSVGALVDTGFGRAIVAKALLLLALVGLGAWQRRRAVPQLRRIAADAAAPGRAGVLLRRALRAEVLLLVGVMAATAALAASSPLGARQAGPFDATTELGPLQLQLTVDPALVGPNAVHIYLLDPRDGSQFAGAREVTVTATQPERGIGPLREVPDLAGPGHYTLASTPLGVDGTWELRVTVRVSDFDQYDTTVEVPIR